MDIEIYIAREESRDVDGYEFYSVVPDEIYPATIREMKEAGELTALDEELALTPAAVMAGRSQAEIEHRAAVLEKARLRFTRQIKKHIGRPVGVHILADDRFRLKP